MTHRALADSRNPAHSFVSGALLIVWPPAAAATLLRRGRVARCPFTSERARRKESSVQRSRGSAAARASIHNRTRSASTSRRSAKRRIVACGAASIRPGQLKMLRRVVRTIPDEGLWVDHEPRLALGAQYVARVQIGREQHVVGRGARQLLQQSRPSWISPASGH